MKKAIFYTKGFTLMDILISTAIISLLSSVILFNVSEGKVKAQDAQMKVESSQVATAIEMYKTNNEGRTPIRVWSQSNTRPANVSTGKLYEEKTEEYTAIMNKLVEEGYLSGPPKSPTGTSYAYGENTEGTQAMFAAQLRSSYSIDRNTSNSCSIAEEFVSNAPVPFSPPSPMVMLPNCTVSNTSGIGTDQLGYPVYSASCPPISGVEIVCSYSSMYILPPGATEFQYVQVPQECHYVSPPPVVAEVEEALCSGGNEEDYCTCI